MSVAIYPALLFTVALLVTTTYFLLGGLPLLVLDHGTAWDASFVRSFFKLYYKAAFITSTGASISFAGLGRPGFAIGAAALAVAAILLRNRLLPIMDELGFQIQTSAPSAIQRFRRIHLIALTLNLVQLVLVVWALIRFEIW